MIVVGVGAGVEVTLAALFNAAFGCCMTQDSVSMNNIKTLARIKYGGHWNRPMIVSFIFRTMGSQCVCGECVGVGCGLRMIRACTCAYANASNFVLFKF